MTKKMTRQECANRDAFFARANALIAGLGCTLLQHNVETDLNGPSTCYEAGTKFGRLHITVRDNAVMTRFDAPQRVLAGGVLGALDLNPHSGKWNHYPFKMTAADLDGYFTRLAADFAKVGVGPFPRSIRTLTLAEVAAAGADGQARWLEEAADGITYVVSGFDRDSVIAHLTPIHGAHNEFWYRNEPDLKLIAHSSQQDTSPAP